MERPINTLMSPPRGYNSHTKNQMLIIRLWSIVFIIDPNGLFMIEKLILTSFRILQSPPARNKPFKSFKKHSGIGSNAGRTVIQSPPKKLLFRSTKHSYYFFV